MEKLRSRNVECRGVYAGASLVISIHDSALQRTPIIACKQFIGTTREIIYMAFISATTRWRLIDDDFIYTLGGRIDADWRKREV